MPTLTSRGRKCSRRASLDGMPTTECAGILARITKPGEMTCAPLDRILLRCTTRNTFVSLVASEMTASPPGMKSTTDIAGCGVGLSDGGSECGSSWDCEGWEWTDGSPYE